MKSQLSKVAHQPATVGTQTMSRIQRSFVWLMVSMFAHVVMARQLPLPDREKDAPVAAALIHQITDLPLQQREDVLFKQVIAGNVPKCSRELVPITVESKTSGTTTSLTFFATADYLAVGSDTDYLLIPLTPFTAQKVADRLNCSLPTTQIVNLIYSNAAVKLEPTPTPPTPAMTTVPVFVSHNETVRKQRELLLAKSPAGSLTAGHKKDVVISNKLLTATNKVAIYGWHKSDGKPIQPLFTGHTAAWADYSHGIRLISNEVLVNGEKRTLQEVLADPGIAPLVSNEGPMKQPRYQLSEFPKDPSAKSSSAAKMEVAPASCPGEQVTEMKMDPAVRIQINAPADIDPAKKLLLVFYALPNGNTIEQTAGKKIAAGDDWHFDIQHIAAQTRFLRAKLTNETIVVAYLENQFKTWPFWRKTNGDSALPKIIQSVSDRFKTTNKKIVLAGHSGGGSFIFGYLNTQPTIPDEIERIAFLDANYGYETALHHEKLSNWLKASDQHRLMVLAYHDNIALLDGKTFVSAAGGTWGKSHLMLTDFEKDFPLTRTTKGNLERVTAIDGRFQFLLMENPEKKILHTVQVERNGFIQVMLAGTELEGKGYEYFGDRAYSSYIK